MKHVIYKEWSNADVFTRKNSVPNVVEKERAQFAGIEIFSALAHYIGILEPWFETITQRLDQIPLKQCQILERVLETL